MRKYNVTRTMSTTIVSALVVDGNDALATVEVRVPREYKTDKELTKAVSSALPAGNTLVRIKETRVEHALYGMTEETFLANAIRLDDTDEAENK